MEPTIYKPSIYKGAGIYKTGAEGGGCGGDIEKEIEGFIYKFRFLAGFYISLEDSKIINDSVGGELISGIDGVYYNTSQIFQLNTYLHNNYYGIAVMDYHTIDYVNYYLGNSTSDDMRSSNGWTTTNGNDTFGFSFMPNGYLDDSKNLISRGVESLQRLASGGHSWINANLSKFNHMQEDSTTQNYYMQARLILLAL